MCDLLLLLVYKTPGSKLTWCLAVQLGTKGKAGMPTWGYVAVGAGAGGIYYLYKNRQRVDAESASSGGDCRYIQLFFKFCLSGMHSLPPILSLRLNVQDWVQNTTFCLLGF